MESLIVAAVAVLTAVAAFAFSAGSLWQPAVLLDRGLDVGLWLAATCGAWAAGRLVLGAGKGGRGWGERLAALGLGYGLAFAALFALGAIGCLTRATAWGLLALLLLLGAPRLPSVARDAAGAVRATWASGWGRLALALAALALPAALAPPTSQDALVYHLAVPARWIETGRIAPVPGNIYSGFPMNMELLFAWGLLLKGAAVAKLFHWGMAVAAAGAVAACARRLGGTARWAAFAALAFLSTPTVFRVASWAYVGLAVVFFQLLAFLAYLDFRASGRPGRLVVAGLFCGLAAGVKYTGGLVLAPIAIDLVWRAIAARRARAAGGEPRGIGVADGPVPRLRHAPALALPAALVFLPWAVRGAVTLGNPVYPFLYSIFGGRGWDAERAWIFSAFLGGWGGRSCARLLELPYALSLRSAFFSIEGFDGVIGPLYWIALPVAAVAVARVRSVRVAFGFAAALLVGWLALTWQIRFLVPALAFLAIGIAAAMPRVLARPASRRAVSAALGFAVLVNVAVDGALLAAENPFAYALGGESRDAYYTRRLPGGDWPVFAYIERELPADSRILMAACGNPGYLCRRPYHADAVVENWTLRRLLEGAPDPETLARRLRREGFTHLLFRWSLVFGRPGERSDLSFPQQRALAAFLNARCERLARASETQLYRIRGSG